MNNTIDKTILFYSISFNPIMENNGLIYGDDLFEIFNKVFPESGEGKFYNFDYDKNNYGFEILELNKNFLFGSYVKDIEKQQSLMRYREKITYQTAPFTPPENKYLEYYSWFYIDFKYNRIAAIKSKDVPSIDKLISSYFHQKTNYIKSMMIIPIHIKDLKKTVEKSKNIKCIEFQFAKPDEFTALGSEHFDVTFSECRVKAKVSQMGNLFSKKIHQNSNSKFDVLKLTIEDDDGIDQCIDMIKNILTLKVRLTFEDSDLFDSDVVKTALAKHINFDYE